MVERWVSVDGVAAHIGVRKDSIYRWIEHQGLPAQKIGKLWKLKLSEVDTWMRARGANRKPPNSGAPSNKVSRAPQVSPPHAVVLVIEDDEVVRDNLGDFLADEGYEALLAADGAEALELLASTTPPPSLIVFDLGMPNMGGWQFRERQLQDAKLMSIPVVVVTADRNASVPGAALLAKPLRLDQLANAIEKLLKP